MKKNAFKEIEPFSAAQFLFAGKLSSLKKKERWYSELKARFLLLETMLKLEQEKRKIGGYPESAPEWLPLDPFTGRKFHYKKGDMPILEAVHDPKTNQFRTVQRTVKAVALWSEGVNRKNDQGLTSRRKSNWDDIRVMIRL